jgi:ATP-dependent DNA ligase
LATFFRALIYFAVSEHACQFGLEGDVSKRLDSMYRSGPSKTWLKAKNPASEAVRWEREEEWRQTRPWTSDA